VSSFFLTVEQLTILLLDSEQKMAASFPRRFPQS